SDVGGEGFAAQMRIPLPKYRSGASNVRRQAVVGERCMIGSAKSVEKASLFRRLDEARLQTDRLFEIVRSHALYERPIPERHRLIFYLGHLEAFDWNLLHENVFGLKSFHPEFDRLFAFGIDPVGGGVPSDQPSDWPSLELVHNYARRI